MAAKIWEWTGEKKGPQLASGDDAVQVNATEYGMRNVSPAFAKNDVGRNYYIEDGNLLQNGMALQLKALPGGGMQMTTFGPI